MHPNLFDQLQVFQAVVEQGGFSAAARQLNRTVAAVGYTIGQLEEQLNLTLFDRSGYRPQLTEQGRSLLRDVSILLRRVERLEARVDSLQQDKPVNVTLLMGSTYLAKPLAKALSELHQIYPEVQVTLQHCPDQFAIEQVAKGEADIVFLQLNDSLDMAGMDGCQLTTSKVKLVASSDHELAKIEKPFAFALLDNYQQIIYSAYAVDTVPYNYGVNITDVWAVNNLELMIELICAGAGWGYLEEGMIGDQVEQNKLKILACNDVKDWPQVRYAAAWQAKKPPGESLQKLLQLLQQHCE